MGAATGPPPDLVPEQDQIYRQTRGGPRLYAFREGAIIGLQQLLFMMQALVARVRNAAVAVDVGF